VILNISSLNTVSTTKAAITSPIRSISMIHAKLFAILHLFFLIHQRLLINTYCEF